MPDSCGVAQCAQPVPETRDELIARSIAEREKKASELSAYFYADLKEARYYMERVDIGSTLLDARETVKKLGELVDRMVDGQNWFHQLWDEIFALEKIKNAS